MTGAAAFDAVAPVYDRLTVHPLGRWLRGRVHERLADAFPAGSRVLELGCGTGEDAAWLARRGVRVTALDASPGMLDEARRKVEAAGVRQLVTLCRIDLDRLPEAGFEPLLDGDLFDGAFSNFGALNCLGDRRRLGVALADAVRPGGRLILVVMARFCLFETLFHLLRARPRVATRRWRDGRPAHAGGDARLRVDYPSPRRLTGDLGPAFARIDCRGLGVVLPPTDLRHVVDRWPRLFERLEPVDRRLSRWPGAGLVADHYVLELRRR